MGVRSMEANSTTSFKNQEITFRSRPRWGLGLGVGVMAWLILMIAFGFTIQNLPPIPKPAGAIEVVFRFAVLLIILLLIPIWLGWSVGRGGVCIFNDDGVRLIRGGKEVFCPWSLFSTAGQPVIHFVQSTFGKNASDLFELPVNPAAVAFTEIRKNGQAIAKGMMVKTPQFRFRSTDLASLTNFYQVRTEEFASLLLHHGRHRAKVMAEDSNPALESTFRLQQNGWMTISLARLAFPQICCGCGNQTTTTQAFRVLHMTGYASIAIPVCEICQRSFKREFRRAFWKNFVMIVVSSATIGFLAGMIVSKGQRRFGFPEIPIIFAVLAGVGGSFVGWFMAKHLASKKVPAPVELHRYLKNGSVTLRFRSPQFTERMLATIQT